MMALAAVGFTVQFGVTNILNLACGDVMTASAFVACVSYSAGLYLAGAFSRTLKRSA
jgi:branched-subunit amino acid ABC-type transport system permease component